MFAMWLLEKTVCLDSVQRCISVILEILNMIFWDFTWMLVKVNPFEPLHYTECVSRGQSLLSNILSNNKEMHHWVFDGLKEYVFVYTLPVKSCRQ